MSEAASPLANGSSLIAQLCTVILCDRAVGPGWPDSNAMVRARRYRSATDQIINGPFSLSSSGRPGATGLDSPNLPTLLTMNQITRRRFA